MKNKLSQEQEQQVKEYYNIYLSKGLSTIPSNRFVAEKAIKRMYQLIDEKEPKIYWVKSPNELVDLVKEKSNLGSNLRSNLGSNLWSNLGSNLRSNLESNLGSNLWSNLESNLWSNLRSNLGSGLFYGQLQANWISFYKYCNEVLEIKYDEKDLEKLNLWVDMMECSCFFVFKECVILMDHPKEIHLDNNGKNNNINDFAIKFQDNTGIYVVHGNEEKDLDCNRLMKEKKITNLEYLESKSMEKENALS